jgi:hypothetical protein
MPNLLGEGAVDKQVPHGFGLLITQSAAGVVLSLSLPNDAPQILLVGRNFGILPISHQ